MNYHASDHENDERDVNPADYPRPDDSGVLRTGRRNQFGRQVDLAAGEVRVRADVALAARFGKIGGADHRLGIGGRQNVVDAVTTRAVRHDF